MTAVGPSTTSPTRPLMAATATRLSSTLGTFRASAPYLEMTGTRCKCDKLRVKNYEMDRAMYIRCLFGAAGCIINDLAALSSADPQSQTAMTNVSVGMY